MVADKSRTTDKAEINLTWFVPARDIRKKPVSRCWISHIYFRI
jgi:hypothetical protein